MGLIVSKFGGTSVASKEKIQQVFTILALNPKRRCVVLSAPGKAPGFNIKVTDLLIALTKKSLENIDFKKDIEAVKKRYLDIYEPLGIPAALIREICSIVDQRLILSKDTPGQYRDAIVASGEEINTHLFTEYLKTKGIKAIHVSPADAGLTVTSEFADAQPLPESYANLSKLKQTCAEAIVIFPGFFGITRDNLIATFSRGGSDLTGSILASALDADEYENWTDVDGIFSANPIIVTTPEQIPALTYKEMRELSYMGFNVLHEEAIKPLLHKKIPIRLRNTNNLKNEGTLIVSERLPAERDIIGIASGGRFCSFTLQKFLMNRETGFGRKLLSIFEELGLSYEHCPSGVDNISVILDQDQLRPESVNTIIRAIEKNLMPDEIKTEFGISLIAVVGEGLIHKIGVLAQAASALGKAGINIKIANQGSSEISMIFGIDSADESKAVNALYNEFFSNGAKKG